MILEFDLFYKNLLNAIRKHVQVNKYQISLLYMLKYSTILKQ